VAFAGVVAGIAVTLRKVAAERELQAAAPPVVEAAIEPGVELHAGEDAGALAPDETVPESAPTAV
jgi:hypothetical protein